MDGQSYGSTAHRLYSILIFSIFSGMINSSETKPVENVCGTEQCIITATNIVKNMNRSVLPCDNFYQFVCGKYDEMLDEIYTKNDLEVIDDMQKTIPTLVRSFLQENSADEINLPYRQAFQLYKLCTDQDAMDRQGITHLQQVIDKIGGWPLVEGETWPDINWETIVGKLSELGYDADIFYDVEIIFNFTPTNRNAIVMGPTAFNQFSSKMLYKLMNIAHKMGSKANADRALLTEDLKIINRLKSIVATEDSFFMMTIEKMMERWPNIDWMTYFTGVFSSSPKIIIDKNDFVILTPGFTDRLSILLMETPKSVIMNYIFAKLIESSLPYLSPDIAMESNTIPNVRTESSLLARQIYCAELTTRELPRIIEAIFTVNYVRNGLQNEIMHLADELKKKLSDVITRSEWLDGTEITKIKSKLSSIQIRIGHEKGLEDDYHTNDYTNLEIDEKSFLYSMLNINRRKINMEYGKLHLGSNFAMRDFTENLMTNINCKFHASTNSLDIMPSLLQDPLINSKLPKYFTYSGIVPTIGHELVHSYDNTMRQFYRDRHDDSSSTRNLFNETVECFAIQYQNYFAKKIKLQMDRHEHSIENMANTVNVQLAHAVYKDWVARNEPEPTLADLEYTPMQIFWISYARNRCAKHNPDNLIRFLRDAENEFHTNVPLANYPEFSEAFDCPPGSPMNPVDRCIL